jgi:hypothetical protein
LVFTAPTIVPIVSAEQDLVHKGTPHVFATPLTGGQEVAMVERPIGQGRASRSQRSCALFIGVSIDFDMR